MPKTLTHTSIGAVTATSQAVEAATSVSSAFTSDTDSDGLVGLAFSSINTVSPKPANTFFDNVKSTLDEALFAADLVKGGAGSYDFGVNSLTPLYPFVSTNSYAVH
jgi:aspergillopepsin I